MKYLIIVFSFWFISDSYSQVNVFEKIKNFHNIANKENYISDIEVYFNLFDSTIVANKINLRGFENFYLLKKIKTSSFEELEGYLIEKDDKYIIINKTNLVASQQIDKEVIRLSVYLKATMDIYVFRINNSIITSISEFDKIHNDGWFSTNYYINELNKENKVVKIETVLDYIENYPIYNSTLHFLHSFYTSEVGYKQNCEQLFSIIW